MSEPSCARQVNAAFPLPLPPPYSMARNRWCESGCSPGGIAYLIYLHMREAAFRDGDAGAAIAESSDNDNISFIREVAGQWPSLSQLDAWSMWMRSLSDDASWTFAGLSLAFEAHIKGEVTSAAEFHAFDKAVVASALKVAARR